MVQKIKGTIKKHQNRYVILKNEIQFLAIIKSTL